VGRCNCRRRGDVVDAGHIDGTEALELQHLYRAMDFLEANKEAIEKEVFFRLS